MLMKRLLAWLEARLGLREAVGPMLMHPIPRGAAGPKGWWYVFGSASLTLLVIQILSGIGLALVYVPTADQAYNSLVYLDIQQPLGRFLRSLHYWSGSAMVVMVVVHMTQVYLHGSFKYPRELNWLTGVLLLFLTLGMAFSGQVLRWDADAYWGVGVGASMAGRVPVFGPYLVDLLLGGPVIGGDTLSRFFALHVFVIPGLLLALVAVHLWLILKRGISEPPVPGRAVDPRTYDAQYEKELKRDGVPFLGDAMLKDAFFSSLTVIVVVILAAVAGPKGPGALPEPALLGANPKPDWPFLWLFALLSLSPPSSETLIILVMPLVLVGALLLVPFVANRGERAPSRRPVAVLSVIVIFTVLGVLTYFGATAPWSPLMDAWSSDAIPERLVKDGTPLQLQGMVVLQNKQCRNCHALDGVGGQRGPDLSRVGIRLTRDQLIDQISNGTPGGGNMPAYGKQIKPAEMTALVELLSSLRPAKQPAAQPAAIGQTEMTAEPP
jgi:ubiquinol-cytochrome c reductase cytochrome b subunit